MKRNIILLLFLSLIGCSLIGHELGRAVDKATGETNNENRTNGTAEGLKLDAEMIEAFLNKRKKKEKEIDTRACTKPNTHQVCTASKGCWCEKT